MGWFLGLVLILSLLIRGWSLVSVPPELFGDELDVGYQAYSLLQTGKDLYAQPLPVFLHSLSEWRLPLIVYHTVPSIAFLGLTEAGVRVPEIVMGALSCLIVYALAYRFSGRKTVALTAAILTAVLPWHLIYSRMSAFGVVTQANFLMLATYFYLSRRQFLSAVFFGLSLYVYGTSLVFVPLWLFALWLFARRPILKLLLILFLIAAPLLYLTIFGSAALRFNQLSVFSAPEVMEDITAYRARHPGLIGRVFYNRPIVYARLLARNYLLAFSPEFLFLRGDPVYRHSVQIIGGLYPMLAPFTLLGVYMLATKKKFLALAWLILAPIPSALTLDGGYHATRLFLMVPPLIIVSAVGVSTSIFFLTTQKFGKLVIVGLSLLALFSLSRVSHYYFYDYPIVSWRWWQVGYKQAFHKLKNLESNYSRVFVNNTYEPSLIRFLFWTRFPPAKFHHYFTIDQPQPEIMPGYDGFFLEDKYFFGQFSDANRKAGITKSFLPGALYLVSQRDDVGGDWDWRVSPPENVTVLHTSVNPEDQPLFYLVTRK